MDKQELQQVQLAIYELVQAEDFENALPVIYSVLEEHPNDAPTLNFLGYIWLVTGKEAFAYQLFRRALQESPSNHALWTSLGRACHELEMYEDAIKYFLKSAELKPDYAMAYANASATLVQLSRWEDAEKSAKMALECNPDELNAQLNLAHCYLAKGQWEEGWKEWDKSLGGKFRKEWTYGDEPRWDGSKVENLVIYGEQGLGDEIFYGTCINKAIEQSENVYIDCDPKLENLFKRSFPKAKVYGTRRDDHPDWINNIQFSARCAVGSLPRFFCTDSRRFPNNPYLVACPERRVMWKALFDSYRKEGKNVIGFTSHGGTKLTNAKGRKLTKGDLNPLLKRSDIQLVSLDYAPDERIDGVKYFDFATQSADYDDTAALIAELDAVIGVNTTALHCSAALGVKTICLVPKYHQWRYAQPSMPWYRHMRLAYQEDKSWSEVISGVNL
jgi:hypothetical protein